VKDFLCNNARLAASGTGDNELHSILFHCLLLRRVQRNGKLLNLRRRLDK
jgi:hypothetical protein